MGLKICALCTLKQNQKNKTTLKPKRAKGKILVFQTPWFSVFASAANHHRNYGGDLHARVFISGPSV